MNRRPHHDFAEHPPPNAELVRAAFRAFNAHNADECLALIAPDLIINLAELPEPSTDARRGGKTSR